MPRFLVSAGLTIAAAAALVALSAPPAVAQTGTIEGAVTDAGTGRALDGAMVSIGGRPVPAGADGRYRLTDIPVGSVTVRVQLLGYAARDQRVTVRDGQTVVADFALTRAAIQLDELVVTGQGRAVERRSLAVPLAVIPAEDIERTAVTDVAQLLQGKVSGATVNATSAQAGTSGLINFRGVSSVFGSQTPVIYIDGVRVDNSAVTSSGTGGEESSALADLLTSDIERIEITKGGAASTLYGSDAASGVIQIFTKKGTPGPARVNVRIEQGADLPELKYMFDTGVIYPDEITAGADPNFLRNNFFKTGHYQNYYVAANGGSENTTYSVSGRIQLSNGVQPKNENDIFSLNGAIRTDLSGKVSVNFTANYTRSKFGRLFNGSAIADPLTSFEVGDVFFFTGEDNFDDALTRFILPSIDETVTRFRFTSGFNWTASPLFSARGTLGLDYRTNTQREFSPIGAVFINGGDGQVQRFQRDFNTATLDVAGTVSYPRDGTVTSNFTFGVQGFRDDEAITNVTGQTFALPGTPNFDQAATVTATENNTEIFNGGFYFQEEVGVANRLFLNGGLRLDANSAFGDEVNVEVYPKAGLAYLISEEAFFQNSVGRLLNTLKLRVAYGQTGKFPTPFLRDRSFTATQFRGESAPRFDNPGNPDLAPEVTKTVEFGFDAALIGNRVGIGFTYFDAKTEDALFFVPEQPVTGLGTQLRNVGKISNTGIELDASAQVINSRALQWSLNATYHAVKNRVTDMGGAAPFSIPGTGGQQRVEVGHPVGAWYVFTPIDTNGDGLLDGSEQQFTGSQPTPTKSGSISTTVTLRNALTFFANADWATGHQVFDWGSIWATFNGIFRRELIEDGYVYPTRYDVSGNELGNYSQNAARSAFVLDGDFLKVRELGVRWTVPSSAYRRFGFDRATLYLNVRNAFIFSRTPMIDPELNGLSAGGSLQLGGQSSVTLSPPKQLRFGLDLTF